ncbi:hypothetical protein AMJ39_02295 [candidate division TA06 bacterium DG_24]|uniref:Uncharacterized protein n=2 Tax=Bacteria division TA06 TaxID=1156500 RepID=A0A0S8JKM8_UNCT6|nr:MAG: hypothetical protein AMJ39_02295 [candidate division TA06 bacterium DG_24]KPL10303.1 MAG: hypothetical protein AMJ71_03540 [candidate division TA06 bacterium SM1_40]
MQRSRPPSGSAACSRRGCRPRRGLPIRRPQPPQKRVSGEYWRAVPNPERPPSCTAPDMHRRR